MIGHSRHRRPAAVGSALALGLAGIVGSALPAAADDVECGDIITTSTALTHDLVCDGTTDGLVIGANDITLDLKGFTISGPGSSAFGSGVRAAQRGNVTITNGTITGFRSGVVLDQTVDSAVTKIVAQANDQGINLAGGARILVSRNTATANDRDGIRLGGTVDAHVTQNTALDNTWGISVSAASGALIDRNIVTGSEGVGLAAFDAATGTTFAQNKVSGGSGHGISVHGGSTSTLVLQNQTWSNSGDGIFTLGTTTVTKNTSTYNGLLGINAGSGAIDGGGNRAAGNGDPDQCEGVVCTLP